MAANGVLRWKYEAQIGFHLTFASYLTAYQKAAEILFNQIEEKEVAVNTVSYPYLFLVRHSLELGYKMNIDHLSKTSGLTNQVNSMTHCLSKLHPAFRKHFMAVANKYPLGEDEMVQFKTGFEDLEALMNRLDKIDPGYSFRYHLNKKEELVFPHEKTINLLDIQEPYNKAIGFLVRTTELVNITD